MKQRILMLAAGLVLAVAATTQAEAATFRYSVKFVCGFGEEVVVPGVYTTAINIYNPNYGFSDGARSEIKVVATAFLLYPPQEDSTTTTVPIWVNEDEEDGEDGFFFFRGVEIDCELLFDALDSTDPFIKGIVAVTSDRRLDITAVYTASDDDSELLRSIDVEQIYGRRISGGNAGKLAE